jgi:hypothetical protein
MAGDVNAARETTAAACRPWDFLEGAMALEMTPALQNDVSVMCARAAPDDVIPATPSLSLAENAINM